jgi:hypothetical protein
VLVEHPIFFASMMALTETRVSRRSERAGNPGRRARRQSAPVAAATFSRSTPLKEGGISDGEESS